MGRGFDHNWGKVWLLSANDAVSKATHLHQNVELDLPSFSACTTSASPMFLVF
jgi:hypothetical protein